MVALMPMICATALHHTAAVLSPEDIAVRHAQAAHVPSCNNGFKGLIYAAQITLSNAVCVVLRTAKQLPVAACQQAAITNHPSKPRHVTAVHACLSDPARPGSVC